MTNRFSSSFRVLGGITALIVLGLTLNFFISQFRSSSPISGATESVDISPPAEDRLLAFTSDQSGNFEIYIMHPDGSGLTNVTNHPASDTYPFWSPDGRRIAFTSDRDSSNQLYLMDANGSNVIQLTNGEGNYWFDPNRHSPWAPDGRKLIFSHKLPGEQGYKLYVMELADQTITTLTDEAGQYLLTSWSTDGEYIAFAADAGGTSRDLFIVSRDGTRLTKLTENLGVGEFFVSDYHWSQNGDTLIFIAGARVYAAGLDGSLTVIGTADRQILDWWNETVLLDDPENTLTWLRSDGSQSTLDLCQNSRLLGIAHRRSYGGNLVVGSNCSEGGLMFYWANQDGTVAHSLLDAPISWEMDVLFNPTWSPDDQYLVFVGLDTASPDVTETLYVLDVAKAREDPSMRPLIFTDSFGPSWQPVVVEVLAEEKPAPGPEEASLTESLIAFTADGEDDKPDIYTVHPDGSGLVNLTNTPATESSPAWSPDGKRLAFVSARDGDENIYVMQADGSDLIRVTDDPTSDMGPVWSPDGAKIAYVSRDSNRTSSNIHVVDSNGQNRRQLTSYDAQSAFWTMDWSPDSQLLFLNFGQQILRVDVSNGNALPVTAFTDVHPFTDFVLSQDGSKLYFLSECSENSAEFCKRIKSVDMDGTNEETHETIQLERVCTSGGAPLNKVNDFYYATIWSPDRTKIAFAFNCFEYGGLIYIANADGSDFKPLTGYPILYKDTDLDWSQDGQSIVFTSALEDNQTEGLYLLNVADALHNPELRPTRLNVFSSHIGSLAWQPIP